MNMLSQDIHEEIAAVLQSLGVNLPPLATISRQWQAAIERQTFRTVPLKSTDLDRFQTIVCDSRRGYVNAIHYHVILPAYSNEERGTVEREDTRQANDEAFTAAIRGLFKVLKSWDVCKDGYIDLRLGDTYSNSDYTFLRRSSSDYKYYSKWNLIKRPGDGGIADMRGLRFRYSFLRLLDASELPMVPVVRSFTTSDMTRNIYDRVPIDVAARLPSLRRVDWVMNDWEIRYIRLRRTHRQDLARAFEQNLPISSNLEHLTVDAPHNYQWRPELFLGNLNSDYQVPDVLSGAIWSATTGIRTLKTLSISGAFDKSLFWPGPTSSLHEPFWQNIENLTVHLSVRRPSGGCYFRGLQETRPVPEEEEVPPGYRESAQEDSEWALHFVSVNHIMCEEQLDEVSPDDAALKPLIEAFGQACVQMPKLKQAHLSAHIPVPLEIKPGAFMETSFNWGIRYLSPGTLLVMGKDRIDPACFEDVHQRRLFWDVMDWRPDHELRALLCKIGSHKYGPNLVEKFVDTWGTVGKDPRSRVKKRWA